MGKHSYNILEHSTSEHLPLQFDIMSVLTLSTAARPAFFEEGDN
ncbi:hypothetical protein F444_15553 [Phytophthora nicotianae P1976]|uniref:Uncharacterized protein n=1 Tax=Phytophthora nicotianae P1976 TaxID=1317066 RepID=A0A080ZLP5_PHYNI|nr:hypothetical protein F444_15553 [Phytophthora nicotianae P1976]